jgi:hypothetical protein
VTKCNTWVHVLCACMCVFAFVSYVTSIPLCKLQFKKPKFHRLGKSSKCPLSIQLTKGMYIYTQKSLVNPIQLPEGDVDTKPFKLSPLRMHFKGIFVLNGFSTGDF